MRFRTIAGALAVGLALSSPAAAQDWFLTPEPFDEAFFGFASRTNIGLNPFAFDGYEDNYVFGIGYQRFRGTPDGVRVGLEVGLAARFGELNSAELWGGIVGRMDFELFNVIRLSPAFTFGLSAVTGVMAGSEQQHVIEQNGDPTLLFYLGPEISASLIDHPEAEVFVRLHHRSGAWGRLGNLQGGLDAFALGLRYQF